RHADKKIADVLRNWIEHTTMGRVKTYQSSQPGQGPRPGYILTEEVRRQLQAASVVLCIFTVHDHDWSYCLWECGVATDPGAWTCLLKRLVRLISQNPSRIG